MNLLPVLECPSDEARVREILSLFYRMKTSWHIANAQYVALAKCRLPRAARLALDDRFSREFYALHGRMQLTLDYLCRMFAKGRAPGHHQIGRYDVQVLDVTNAGIFVDTDRLLMFDSCVVIHRAGKR